MLGRRNYKTALESKSEVSSARLPWAGVEESSTSEIASLTAIMDTERIVALIRSGRAGTSSKVLIPNDMEAKMPLLYSSLRLLAIYARIELLPDATVKIGTVNFPGIFGPAEGRETVMTECMNVSPRQKQAVEMIVALADLAGRMPSRDNLMQIGGSRPVYRWFASLAILYYEEQVKKVNLSTGRVILRELEKDKKVLCSLFKTFCGNEAACLKILTAYEIAMRKLAVYWATSDSEKEKRDILVSQYYEICVKDVAEFTMESCHKVKTKVQKALPSEGKQAKFQMVEVTNIVIPSASADAPLGIKEKLTVSEFNRTIKNVLFEEFRGELLSSRDDDTSSRLVWASARVEAAYTLCKRVNDLLRARRREALVYCQESHTNVVKGLNLNPTTPKETHALFSVVQPFWEKYHPEEDSISISIREMLKGKAFEISISELLNGQSDDQSD